MSGLVEVVCSKISRGLQSEGGVLNLNYDLLFQCEIPVQCNETRRRKTVCTEKDWNYCFLKRQVRNPRQKT